jgi:putative DNA primase/helicase
MSATLIDARTLAHALGGEFSGRDRVLVPGPGHSRAVRSLSVKIDPRARDGFIVNSFAGDDPTACRDHVRERLGLPAWMPSTREQASMPRPAAAPVQRDEDEGRKAAWKQARAFDIWHEASYPRGTIVEKYLTRPKAEGGRGLELPDEAAGEAIRFHPACPFAGERVPAMVCLVRDIVTNEPTAIHRTVLSRDGFKVEVKGYDRLTLGPISGGAIKLTPDEDVTTCIGIGEGLETTLSLRRLPEYGPSPVWSALNSGGVSKFPVLPGIECLWIAVDQDPGGIRAAQECADRWREAGREVFLIQPRGDGRDLNDIIQRGAAQ